MEELRTMALQITMAPIAGVCNNQGLIFLSEEVEIVLAQELQEILRDGIIHNLVHEVEVLVNNY